MLGGGGGRHAAAVVSPSPVPVNEDSANCPELTVALEEERAVLMLDGRSSMSFTLKPNVPLVLAATDIFMIDSNVNGQYIQMPFLNEQLCYRQFSRFYSETQSSFCNDTTVTKHRHKLWIQKAGHLANFATRRFQLYFISRITSDMHHYQ